jgi:hypothetical protein
MNIYQCRYLYSFGGEQCAMYSLEYGMMIRVLHQLKSSGEFHADVPPQAALKSGGHIVLFMQSGNVVSCLIFNSNGQKLYHDAEAQRLLPKLGVLEWKRASSTPSNTFNPNTPNTITNKPNTFDPITPPVAPKANYTERKRHFNPRRLRVSETQMRSWSILERSVYSLADGVHSIEQIATLLSRPTTVIEQIIQNFEASGIITRS